MPSSLLEVAVLRKNRGSSHVFRIVLILTVFAATPSFSAIPLSFPHLEPIHRSNGPIDQVTPVILVHGHHSESQERARWGRLEEYIAQSAEFDNHDVYIWWHDSTKAVGYNGSTGNAKELADTIANEILPLYSKPIVLVAHSRGGLVCRAYMNYNGQHANIKKLITLGTPHHGSPYAITDWVAYVWKKIDDAFKYDTALSILGDVIQYSFLMPSTAGDVSFEGLFNIIESSFLPYAEDGHNNLAWDDMDDGIDSTSFAYDVNASNGGYFDLEKCDANTVDCPAVTDRTIFYSHELKLKGTLREMNANEPDIIKNKIVTFAAFDDELPNKLISFGNSSFADIIHSLRDSGMSHAALNLLNRLMMLFHFNDNDNYIANDGMVPLQSALYLDLSVDRSFSISNFNQNSDVILVFPNIDNINAAKQVSKHYILNDQNNAIGDHLALLDADLVNPYWQTLSDEITRTDGAVVFASDAAGQWDIWTMSLASDGTSSVPVNLTNGQYGNCRWPDWSPDGAKIVFNTDRHTNTQLYTMDADGGNVTRLTNDSDWYRLPRWSPDGRQVVVSCATSQPNSCSAYNTMHVRVFNENGTLVRAIPNDSSHGHYYPEWSRDGSRIFYARDESTCSNPYDLFVMGSDGTDRTRIYPASTDWVYQLRPLPDDAGNLVFTQLISGIYGIRTVDADGSNAVTVIHGSRNATASDRAFDDAMILYQQHDGAEYKLYMADINGTNRVMLSNQPDGSNADARFHSGDAAAVGHFDLGPILSVLLLDDAYAGDALFPLAEITVDGNYSDWDDVPVHERDTYTHMTVPGSDIDYIKFAYSPDGRYLYLLLKVTDVVSKDVVYRFFFEDDTNCNTDNDEGDFQLDIETYSTGMDNDTGHDWAVTAADTYLSQYIELNEVLNISGSYIEARFDAAPLNQPSSLKHVYGRTMDWEPTPGTNFQRYEEWGQAVYCTQ